MSNVTNAWAIVIRDIDRFEELRAVEALQKQVWGCSDLDVAPLTILAATREVGGVLIGAYDSADLVGFVYGFPGYEAGRVTHHSHMLAVKPAYRNHDLGYQLKLAQRERVLAQGIERVTWTFDPLQSINAHFNFGKLGVVADSYKIDFYCEATSSFLHQLGTDRLWVTWVLNSERVRARLQGDGQQASFSADEVLRLVQVGPDQTPRRNISSRFLGQKHLSIEIPADINDLQRRAPTLAVEWREATRWSFTEALRLGYFIDDFSRSTVGKQTIGRYLLSYGS